VHKERLNLAAKIMKELQTYLGRGLEILAPNFLSSSQAADHYQDSIIVEPGGEAAGLLFTLDPTPIEEASMSWMIFRVLYYNHR